MHKSVKSRQATKKARATTEIKLYAEPSLFLVTKHGTEVALILLGQLAEKILKFQNLTYYPELDFICLSRLFFATLRKTYMNIDQNLFGNFAPTTKQRQAILHYKVWHYRFTK